MPYNVISDLPKAQTDQYTEHQKHAFLKAFNNAYDEYGGDEHRAFAVAHAAAKKAGGGENDAEGNSLKHVLKTGLPPGIDEAEAADPGSRRPPRAPADNRS